MQDEVNSQVVALYIRTGKDGARLTAAALKAAMRKYLQSQEKAGSSEQSRTCRGKQSIGQLMEQNTELTNIEVTDKNIRSFERVARKYNIDFALKKDKAAEPPRYLVFFKARDVDVMNAAFREFSAKQLDREKKPSIRKQLSRSQEKAKEMLREKVKVKDRGPEL